MLPSVRTSRRWGSTLAVLALFAIAMGYLEAVVVVYLRSLLGVSRGADLPPGEVILERIAGFPWLLGTEQGRELATLVMIGALSWLAGRGLRRWVAAYLFVFGVWDLAYYAALRLLLGWPTSLATRDVLFLVPPGPWWDQPVWVPMAFATCFIGAGAWLGRRER